MEVKSKFFCDFQSASGDALAKRVYSLIKEFEFALKTDSIEKKAFLLLHCCFTSTVNI